MKPRFVFLDPPSPPGFVSFKHSHGGYGEFCRKSRLRVPTLDLFHGASLLLERGVDAQLVDSVLEDHTAASCAEEVARRKPSWVVIRTAAFSLPADLELARLIKDRTGAKIALYGHQLSVEPDSARAAFVDAVIPGDSPFSFLPLAGLPAQDDDLDALPVPRWDLVDFRRYSYVTTQTSWGCAFSCGYCSYPITQGRKWRTRSVASVVSEFKTLRKKYGLRFVLLRDPEFTMSRKRTVELLEGLIGAEAPLAFACETRLDTLDEELMDLLARAGCLRVNFGVETLNAEALRLMGRPEFGRAAIREKVAALKRRGMLTYALYILGLPGETRRSARELVDFALELGTDAASFSMATPFPGTELERLARARGWITAPNPRRLTSSVPSMRNETLEASEIEALYLEAKDRWTRRARPSLLSSPA